MPHRSILIGSVRITALCDAVTPFPRPLEETFRLVPATAWRPYQARFPETFEAGAWRLRLHCFLVEDDDRVVLVDTGAGPAAAPGAAWLGVAGRLLDELTAIDVDPAQVDDVVLTHLHLDHVGWNVLSEGGRTRATFPRARYHVQRADWDAFSTGGDANDRAAFEAVVRPLEELGCLELVDGDQPLTAALGLLHTPGHTPGSQSLTVMSNGEQALLWGDVATHPAQITEPSWSGTDVDPGMATATRESLFARIEAEGFIAAPAHFPEPFGSIVRLEGRRWWRALRAEDQ